MSTTCNNCECICVVPLDCGQCGCDTGPAVCKLTASPAPSCLYKTENLVSTKKLPLFQRTDYDFGAGTNMLNAAWPWICDTNEEPASRRVIVNLPPMAPLWFTWNSTTGEYEGQRPAEDWTLAYGSWTLTSPDGEIWQFTGFEDDEPKGRFVRYTSPGGNGYAVYDPAYRDDPGNPNAYPYTDGGHIKGIVATYQEGGQPIYRYLDFEYTVDAADNEHLQSATVRRKAGTLEDLERVLFSYGAVDVGSGGSAQTLYSIKSITRQIHQDTAWVSIGQTFTKHYGESDANGGANAPKYDFDEEAYQRLMADPQVSDPDTASDAKLAQYATTYFEYDAEGRVAKRRSADGVETTYAYTDGGGSESSRNAVASKVFETRGNCAVQVTYENFHGQTILSESKELSEAVGTLNFYQYDSNGNVTLHATQSALAGYTVSGSTITPDYKSSGGQYTVGLVHVYEYYDETTTGTGGTGVKGYKKFDKVKQGRDGAEINVRKYEYTEHAASVELPGGSSSSSSSSSSGNGAVDLTVYLIARETVYPNEDGSAPIETSYTYTWHAGSVRMLQRTTTLPAVPTWQNGSGTSATRVERFDKFGRLEWLKDERGYITYKEYDLASGNATQSIDDVDDTQLTVPSGWSTPTGGGKHLVTDFEYDSLDRLTQTLGPEHAVDGATVRTASWTVYKTADRETRSAQGYAVSDGQGGYNYTLVNPVRIEKRNAMGTRSESPFAVRAATTGKLTASDTFAQSSYVRWSVSLYGNAGQLTANRAYHAIPASGDGSSGTNYDESTFGYDGLGRQNKSVTPGGTIRRTVFDARGHAVADYVGTNDSGATDADPTGADGDPHLVLCTGGSGASSSSSLTSSSSSGTPDPNNNMVLVAEREYCAGSAGCPCGGGGAGQLVSETRHVDVATWHTTDFEYDWRGRTLHVYPPADDAGRTVYSQTTYDNLDRAVKQERYLEISGSADRLLARSETYYDDRGRVYQTKRFAVNVDTGAVGNSLVGNTWYDAIGNVIKQQPAGSQAFTKTVYDSLGRAVRQYLGYDTDETDYADASSVSDDTIVEQSEITYDDAGNVLQTTTRQRFHNATGTGELTTPSGGQPKARVTYVAMYADEIGRQIAVANYGTYGGLTFDRATVVPNRTDTILVTSTEYDDAGQAYKTIDPAGREDRQEFDAAGRVVKTIQNYVDGVVDEDYPDEDVTVEMAYNADGQLLTLTAKNPATGDQVTKYVYGTTLSDSEIATSTLKRAEIYPDSDDTTTLGNGPDGIYDRIEFKYDRQRRVTEVNDQQETVHAFAFDALGRQTQDRVTALGAGVDNAVRRIATTYDVVGHREKMASYDHPTVGSGSVVNEVRFVYNDFGQLVTEYQEHGGAVNTSTSLKIEYSYADGSSGTIRPTRITYPDGRELNYDYGSAGSTDDALLRVAALIDDDGATHLVDYSRLGAGLFVETDYAGIDVKHTLVGTAGANDPDTGDIYRGLDRFGQVKDCYWYNYGSSADVLHIKHGYDRVGNRLYREEADASDLDQLYAFDDLNRLAQSEEGTLSIGKDSISSLTFKQQWSLDATGNWSGFKEDDDGDSSWELEQTRTSDKVNEITDVSETAGPSWITPAYSRAGNMTTIPKPGDATQSYTATYDAWNRLVKLEEGEDTVAEYVFDGVRRLVVRKKYVSGSLNQTRHFYYTDQWQTIEERLESGGQIAGSADRQFVWGLRYIDDLVCRTVNSTHDYAYQDANWNVVLSSAALARVGYAPYGQIRSTCPAAQGDLDDWQYYFAGYRRDEDTGLYLVRHRVYQPELGCWVQRDPIGYTDSPSLVMYSLGAPARRSDSSGLSSSFTPGCCGMEISQQLRSFEKVLEQQFQELVAADRSKATTVCHTMVAPMGWEVFELFDKKTATFSGGGCGTDDCRFTVQVHGACHYASEVNYFIFGLGNRLCHDASIVYAGSQGGIALYGSFSLSFALWYVRLWRTVTSLMGDGTTAGRLAWTRAGYDRHLAVPADAKVSKNCALCHTKYRGSLWGYIGVAGIATVNAYGHAK